jgi:phosphohistidine phosphatase
MLADIFEKVQPGIEALGLTCDCVGGGRIQHNNTEKSIHVYGYSMGYGRADHTITVQKLRDKYANYIKIDFSNEGY